MGVNSCVKTHGIQSGEVVDSDRNTELSVHVEDWGNVSVGYVWATDQAD